MREGRFIPSGLGRKPIARVARFNPYDVSSGVQHKIQFVGMAMPTSVRTIFETQPRCGRTFSTCQNSITRCRQVGTFPCPNTPGLEGFIAKPKRKIIITLRLAQQMRIAGILISGLGIS